MTKRRGVFRAYEASLILYPKEFREVYGEQILIAAQDILQSTPPGKGRALVAGRLFVDLLLAAIKENKSQLGGNMREQAKISITGTTSSIAMLGLEALGVIIISLVWLNSLRYSTENLFSAPMVDWGNEVIVAISPLLMLPLTFIVLRTASQLSQWQKVVRAYAVGVGGTVCYLAIASIMGFVGTHFYPQLFAYFWAISCCLMVGFYLVALRFKHVSHN